MVLRLQVVKARINISIKTICGFFVLLFLQVSQGDATEKLAHQVAAQVAAADCRVEEASGDPHEEEKDEAHKSSKGHVSGKYGLCCMDEC